MAFTSNQPPSLASIPCLTLVSARGVNGDLLASWCCLEERAMDVVSMAFIIKLSASLDIPQRCIHLIWGLVEDIPECGRTMPDASCVLRPTHPTPTPVQPAACVLRPTPSTSVYTKRVTMTVVVGNLGHTNEIWGETISECDCCGDPCIDVDTGPYWDREDNCGECLPCMLCDSCRVHIPRLGPLCLKCVTDSLDEYAEFLSPAQLKRYYLTEAAWR